MSGVETSVIVGYVAAGSAAAGSAYAAYSSYQQGRFQRRVGETNAAIAAQNAEIARQEGAQAKKVGEFKIRQEGRRKRVLIGKQRVAQAGSGVAGRTGDILIADTERQSAIDAALIRFKSEGDARSFLREGDLFLTQSQLALSEGEARFRAGRTRAFTTLLSGAGRTAGQFASSKQQRT